MFICRSDNIFAASYCDVSGKVEREECEKKEEEDKQKLVEQVENEEEE